MKILLHFLIGALTGALSGMGIGGGSLLLLYLTAVMNVPTYIAGGMNLLYFLCCAPTALITHSKAHRLVPAVIGWSILGGVLTAVPAALLAAFLPARLLRRLFGGLLLYVGVRELLWKPRSKMDSPVTSAAKPPS